MKTDVLAVNADNKEFTYLDSAPQTEEAEKSKIEVADFLAMAPLMIMKSLPLRRRLNPPKMAIVLLRSLFTILW